MTFIVTNFIKLSNYNEANQLLDKKEFVKQTQNSKLRKYWHNNELI